MRVVVTGASGFLGAWVVRALLADGCEVVALVRSEAPWRLVGLDASVGFELAVAPVELWARAISESRADVLVSLDWAGVDGPLRDSADQWANLDRHSALVEAAISSGVERIVGLGSQAEYGPRTDRIGEDAPTAPVTVYGEAKVVALDRLAERCDAASVSWVWARVFSVFGPLDNEGRLLSVIADSVAAGENVRLSAGDQLWSYLYASDAGRALALLAQSNDAAGVYNVGSPDAPRLRTTIESFAAHLHPTPRLEFGAILSSGSSLTRLEPDVGRLSDLGWSATISLEDGLRRTAEWLGEAQLTDPLVPGRELPSRPRTL